MLECSRSIGESTGHNQEFKKAIAGTESHLAFLTFGHANPVVGVSNVEGSIVTGLGKTVQGFLYQGERISILDCPIVVA
jgi:hypothetical protein